VELAADIAEALDQGALDMGVNVLQLHREGKLATLDLGGNLREGRHNLADLRLAQQADLAKHVSVRLAGEHVLAVEPAVEADRLGEPLNALVGLAAESSSPRLLSAHGCSSHRQNRRVGPGNTSLDGPRGHASPLEIPIYLNETAHRGKPAGD